MPNISKTTILEKVKEYMSRAEAIQEELKNPNKQIVPSKFQQLKFNWLLLVTKLMMIIQKWKSQ